MLIVNGKYNYRALREMAERHDEVCRAKARVLSREGGCHGHIGNILHNALCDFETRTGWGKSVTDWQKIRRANWLVSTECFRGYRILERLYKRKGPDAFNWGWEG